MWIHLSDAFFSLVADPARPADLLVRARVGGDIERHFPKVPVTETPDRDYRFRAWIDRGDVIVAISRALGSIGYTNFKDSVGDYDRHQAYADCWVAMNRYQHQMLDREAVRRRRGQRRH